jgi:hypothetical protein
MITILAVHALLTLSPAQVDTVFRVSRGSRLDLETPSQTGRVDVRAWDRDEVSVETSSPVRVSTTGTLVQVDVGGRRTGRESSVVVSVPRWMPISIDAARAAVTVEGAGADVSVESVGGTVRVRGGNGRVSARSVGGSVYIEDAQGRIEAESLNQNVRLIGVTGEVRAETTNGNISIERAQTSDLVASTNNGSITFDGPIRNDGVYRLTTHNGQVSVAIPENANATVSVSTYNGRYRSTFPISVSRVGPDRRVTFVVGNGSARIEASSFNGNIEFHRPGQPRSVS